MLEGSKCIIYFARVHSQWSLRSCLFYHSSWLL